MFEASQAARPRTVKPDFTARPHAPTQTQPTHEHKQTSCAWQVARSLTPAAVVDSTILQFRFVGRGSEYRVRVSCVLRVRSFDPASRVPRLKAILWITSSNNNYVD